MRGFGTYASIQLIVTNQDPIRDWNLPLAAVIFNDGGKQESIAR